jgi:hypothetical protein
MHVCIDVSLRTTLVNMRSVVMKGCGMTMLRLFAPSMYNTKAFDAVARILQYCRETQTYTMSYYNAQSIVPNCSHRSFSVDYAAESPSNGMQCFCQASR